MTNWYITIELAHEPTDGYVGNFDYALFTVTELNYKPVN